MSDDINKKLGLEFVVDRAKQKLAEKSLDDVDRQTSKLGAGANTTAKGFDNIVKAAQRIERVEALNRLSEQAARAGGVTEDLFIELAKIGASDREVEKAVKATETLTRKFEIAELKAQEFRLEQEKLNEALAFEGGVLTERNRRELRGFREEGRFQSFAVSSLSGVTGNIPGLAAPTAAFAGAFNLLDTIPKLGLTFDVLRKSVVGNIKAIGGAGIGLIGAMGALALAVGFADREAKKARDAFGAVTDAQSEYLKIVETGTKESIQEQIAAFNTEREIAQNELRLREEQRDKLRAHGDQSDDDFARFFRGLSDIGINIGAAGAAFAEADENVENARNEVTNLNEKIRLWNSALESSTVAANDAAEAEKRLALERTQSILLGASEQVKAFEAVREAQRRDSEGNKVRLQTIEDRTVSLALEREALLRLNDESEEVAARLSDITDELGNLSAESNVIRALIIEQTASEQAYISASEAIAASTLRLENFKNNMLAASEATAKASVDIEKLNERTEKALVGIDKKLDKQFAKIEQTATKAIEKAGDSATKATEKANDKATKDQTKALDTRNKAIAKLEQDLADRREQIVRDSNIAIKNAVSSRDAVALLQARENADNALSDLEKQGEDRRTEIDNQYAEQTESINIALQEQLTSIQVSYQEQITAVNTSLQEQRQAAIDAANEQKQELTTRLNEETMARRDAMRQQIQDLNLFGTQGTTAIQTFVQNALTSLNGLNTRSLSAIPIGGTTVSSPFAPTISPTLSISNIGNNGTNLTPGQANQTRTLVNNILNSLLTEAITRGGINTRNVSIG